MKHDFDPLTQVCKTCLVLRTDAEDDPAFAACPARYLGLAPLRLLVQPDEAAEIEKMPQPFRMYAQLIGRDVAEKIAADVLNGAMEDAVSREQWAQALDETLPAPPLPDRGFGV